MRLPRHAEHGVVSPAGPHRPGPRGRRRTRGRLLLGGALVALVSWCLTPIARPSGTEALFTSRAAPQLNTLQGGIWAPEPPTACGDPSGYAGVVYGTPGDDLLYGGNHPQIIMGLAGNDRIYGSNSGDCLVGGAGDDRLFGGNAKDILLGGPGNDYLDGGNAKDYLDGEDDADECDGGNGKDDLVNCDPVTVADAPLPLTHQVGPDLSGPPQEQPAAEPTVPDQPIATGGTAPTPAPDPVPTPVPDPAPTPEAQPTGPSAPDTPEATP